MNLSVFWSVILLVFNLKKSEIFTLGFRSCLASFCRLPDRVPRARPTSELRAAFQTVDFGDLPEAGRQVWKILSRAWNWRVWFLWMFDVIADGTLIVSGLVVCARRMPWEHYSARVKALICQRRCSCVFTGNMVMIEMLRRCTIRESEMVQLEACTHMCMLYYCIHKYSIIFLTH